jgi:hypothetical protein
MHVNQRELSSFFCIIRVFKEFWGSLVEKGKLLRYAARAAGPIVLLSMRFYLALLFRAWGGLTEPKCFWQGRYFCGYPVNRTVVGGSSSELTHDYRNYRRGRASRDGARQARTQQIPAANIVAITRNPAKLEEFSQRGVKVLAGDFSDPQGLLAVRGSAPYYCEEPASRPEQPATANHDVDLTSVFLP